MEIIGSSQGIMEVKNLLTHAATHDANILIYGAAGSGKELVARNIHLQSARKDSSFVVVNCNAHLDILQKHFDSAMRNANNGTLFLDEITDLPIMLQIKLLETLEDAELNNLRIIVATKEDLTMKIAIGQFREDLYYRLNLFAINIPALSDRKEDIKPLINHSLASLSKRMPICSLSDEVLSKLLKYKWPGNVRELINVVEKLCIMYPERIVENNMLPTELLHGNFGDLDTVIMVKPDLSTTGFDLKQHLEAIEVELIQEALQKASGVVAIAARLLGVRRTTLIEKMKKYHIAKTAIIPT